jgi:hypothetical protein
MVNSPAGMLTMPGGVGRSSHPSHRSAPINSKTARAQTTSPAPTLNERLTVAAPRTRQKRKGLSFRLEFRWVNEQVALAPMCKVMAFTMMPSALPVQLRSRPTASG